jgi:hypothetical protein
VLCHFLGFTKTFIWDKIHSMFILMFHPHFKNMDYIMDHIRRNVVTTLVQDLVLLPLMNTILSFLNLNQITIPIPTTLEVLQLSCLGH